MHVVLQLQNTSLCLAARHNCVETSALLIKVKASVNALGEVSKLFKFKSNAG